MNQKIQLHPHKPKKGHKHREATLDGFITPINEKTTSRLTSFPILFLVGSHEKKNEAKTI